MCHLKKDRQYAILATFFMTVPTMNILRIRMLRHSLGHLLLQLEYGNGLDNVMVVI
jgi:hypothetical protein